MKHKIFRCNNFIQYLIYVFIFISGKKIMCSCSFRCLKDQFTQISETNELYFQTKWLIRIAIKMVKSYRQSAVFCITLCSRL